MEKNDKFVIYWYSKIVFNTLNNSTKLIFRKLETETRKVTAEKLHQKFNELYIMYIIIIKIPLRIVTLKKFNTYVFNNCSIIENQNLLNYYSNYIYIYRN